VESLNSCDKLVSSGLGSCNNVLTSLAEMLTNRRDKNGSTVAVPYMTEKVKSHNSDLK